MPEMGVVPDGLRSDSLAEQSDESGNHVLEVWSSATAVHRRSYAELSNFTPGLAIAP